VAYERVKPTYFRIW